MRKALPRILWAVAVYVVLTACALAGIKLYANLVLPFYRWELGLIATEYELQQLDIEPSRGQPAFNIAARNSEYLPVSGGFIPPRSLTFHGQILIMQGLEHVVMLLFVPLAWPGLPWKRRALALACALPILCLVESVDLTWAMVGELDSAERQFVHTPDSLPMIWFHMMATGGSLALGLAGGVLACQLASLFEGSLARKPRRRRARRAARI